MVWAGFTESGKTKMAFLVGKQNTENYTNTLINNLLPFAADKITGS